MALTAPYGHAGAYDTLEAVVRHHLAPVKSLYNYDPEQLSMPSRIDLDELDLVVMNDEWRVSQIAERNELDHVSLNNNQFAALMSFLRALTDTDSLDMRHTIPRQVPSQLPLAE